VSALEHRPDDIEAKAATWIIRLGRGPLRQEERRALDRWLAESPAHEAAFDRARSTWAELGDLKTAPGRLIEDGLSPPRRSFFPVEWRGLAMAAMARPRYVIALVVVGASLGIFWSGNPMLLLEADYRTSPGEVRSVTLADGSRVQLNSDSALAVRFNGGERRVELLAGEAYFIVAPLKESEARPFVVEAANGRAMALGTEFMVDRAHEATDVTVVEHRVEVSATDPRNGRSSVVLSPGQSVRYDRAAGMGKATEVNLGRATAWRRGELVFDKARFSEVVAELNRFRRGRIVIADAGLADRRVSGFFRIDDLDGALASMGRELGVRAMSLPPFLTVLY
jgi:transmembrane sensor